MHKEYVAQLKELIGKQVTLSGWIYNKRSSGKIHFLQFRDGSGFVQLVASTKDVDADTFALMGRIPVESSVVVEGEVREDTRSKAGVEVTLSKLEVIQESAEFPISKLQKGETHGIDFLLNNRHLHLRSQKQWAIQRIRTVIIDSLYDFFEKEQFTKIDSPIFTPNACEGTTDLFEVPYTPAWKEGATTGESVFLTQSGQLYLEAAIFSLGKVFDFGPVFRAEKSKTRRHLTEFWMLDAEMAFYHHEDNMQLQEDMTVYVMKEVLEKCKEELALLEREVSKLEPVLEGGFERITHKKAVEMLKSLGSDIKENDDLGADDETILTKQYDKPIFIEKYPLEVKAFYMKQDSTDPTRALCADMLAPEGYGEIIGGSEREEDYDTLKSRMERENLPIDDFQWYLDLRKYGSVPHSGFGIGLERYVAWVCGLKHIRTTIPFPRMINRTRP